MGVSEGGKGRFLLFTFSEEASSCVGPVGVWISGCDTNREVVENSVPPAPVRGSLALLDLLVFFLAVAVCPAVVVNRVLGHKREGVDNIIRQTYRIVVPVEWFLRYLQGEMCGLKFCRLRSR